MARIHLDNGAIDVLGVLETERVRLQVEDEFVQGRVRTTLAVVSLYKSLAGGSSQYVAQESVAAGAK